MPCHLHTFIQIQNFTSNPITANQNDPFKTIFFLFYELNLPKAKQKTQNQNSIFFIDPVTHLAKNNEKPKKKMN
jgi:hypothetical protein